MRLHRSLLIGRTFTNHRLENARQANHNALQISGWEGQQKRKEGRLSRQPTRGKGGQPAGPASHPCGDVQVCPALLSSTTSPDVRAETPNVRRSEPVTRVSFCALKAGDTRWSPCGFASLVLPVAEARASASPAAHSELVFLRRFFLCSRPLARRPSAGGEPRVG